MGRAGLPRKNAYRSAETFVEKVWSDPSVHWRIARGWLGWECKWAIKRRTAGRPGPQRTRSQQGAPAFPHAPTRPNPLRAGTSRGPGAETFYGEGVFRPLVGRPSSARPKLNEIEIEGLAELRGAWPSGGEPWFLEELCLGV